MGHHRHEMDIENRNRSLLMKCVRFSLAIYERYFMYSVMQSDGNSLKIDIF